MLRTTCAVAALATTLAAAGPASAQRRVEAQQPYINACSLAAAALVGVAWKQVLPGPSFAAPRGMTIELLAGGVPVPCHISNGFTILGLWRR